MHDKVIAVLINVLYHVAGIGKICNETRRQTHWQWDWPGV